MRDSTSYRGSFGLAMKVPGVPGGGPAGVRGCHRTLRPRGADGPSVSPKGDESSDLVRHFLIESSAKGVHLRGASEELYFGKDSRHRRDTTPGPPLRAPSSCAPRGTDGG